MEEQGMLLIKQLKKLKKQKKELNKVVSQQNATIKGLSQTMVNVIQEKKELEAQLNGSAK